MTATAEIRARLEYLRGEIRAERISWGELLELQDLAPYIEPDDVELQEAAGVLEHGYYVVARPDGYGVRRRDTGALVGDGLTRDGAECAAAAYNLELGA